MRISDWSSDVCSSDLDACAGAEAPPGVMPSGRRAEVARQAGRRRPELLQAAQRVVGGVEAVRRQLDVVELAGVLVRSEEHTSELQSLMRISYAVFCLKKKKTSRTQKPTDKHNQ